MLHPHNLRWKIGKEQKVKNDKNSLCSTQGKIKNLACWTKKRNTRKETETKNPAIPKHHRMIEKLFFPKAVIMRGSVKKV